MLLIKVTGDLTASLSNTPVIQNAGTLSDQLSYTFLLVSGWTGSVTAGTTDLDSNNDGVFETSPWTSITDKTCLKKLAANTIYQSALCPTSSTHNAIIRSNQGVALHGTISSGRVLALYNNNDITSFTNVTLTPGNLNRIVYGQGKLFD